MGAFNTYTERGQTQERIVHSFVKKEAGEKIYSRTLLDLLRTASSQDLATICLTGETGRKTLVRHVMGKL